MSILKDLTTKTFLSFSFTDFLLNKNNSPLGDFYDNVCLNKIVKRNERWARSAASRGENLEGTQI